METNKMQNLKSVETSFKSYYVVWKPEISTATEKP